MTECVARCARAAKRSGWWKRTEMNCKYVRWFGEKVLWACPHTLCLLLAAAVLVACRLTRPRLVGATLSLGRAPGFCSCGCSWRAAPPTWADAQAGLGEECYVDETEPMVMVARSEVRFVNVYPSQRVAWSTASPHHNPHGEESTAPLCTRSCLRSSPRRSPPPSSVSACACTCL